MRTSGEPCRAAAPLNAFRADTLEMPELWQDPDELLVLKCPTLHHTGVSASRCLGPSTFPCHIVIFTRAHPSSHSLHPSFRGGSCPSRRTLSHQLFGHMNRGIPHTSREVLSAVSHLLKHPCSPRTPPSPTPAPGIAAAGSCPQKVPSPAPCAH